MEADMVTLLTLDGVEEVDYAPSDAEIRVSLDDPGLYGMVLNGVTWMRLVSGVGWWTVIGGRRVTATLAAIGWCWAADGDARGYWSPALSAVVADVCAMYGGCVEDEEDGDADY